MRIFAGPRASGKTALLLQHVAETDSILVLHTIEMCKTITLTAHVLGFTIKPPISHTQFVNERKYRHDEKYVIDDIEALMCILFGNSIEAVSFDTTDYELVDTITNEVNDLKVSVYDKPLKPQLVPRNKSWLKYLQTRGRISF